MQAAPARASIRNQQVTRSSRVAGYQVSSHQRLRVSLLPPILVAGVANYADDDGESLRSIPRLRPLCSRVE